MKAQPYTILNKMFIVLWSQINMNNHYIFKHSQHNYPENCSCCLPDWFNLYECTSHDLDRVASNQDQCLLVIISSLNEEVYNKLDKLNEYSKQACEWLAQGGITWEFIYESS